MTDAEKEKYLNNMATTAILIDAGIDLMRQNIRRRNPDLTEAQVDDRLRVWLHRADDSIPGDTAGAVRVRERWP